MVFDIYLLYLVRLLFGRLNFVTQSHTPVCSFVPQPNRLKNNLAQSIN